jgi:hypothetical protein
MKPFRVLAEWMDIQPFLRKGRIEWVSVVHVRPNSPAGAAGITMGMRIVEIQGIAIPGLLEDDFKRQLAALPVSDRLTFKIAGPPSNPSTTITVLLDASGRDFTPASPAARAPSLPNGELIGLARPQPVTVVLMDAAAATKRIDEVRRALGAEMDRMRTELRSSGRGMSDPQVTSDAIRSLKEIPAGHLALLCAAAARAENNDILLFRSTLITAITTRDDYASDQKQTVFDYIPKVPELIHLLERMKWFEGSEAALAAGWKKARQDERDGLLGFRGSRYAVIAAHHGLLDALVTLAKTVRTKGAETRGGGRVLSSELAALKALVPSGGSDGNAVAEFVLKNKAKLRFEPATSVYVAGSNLP